MYYFIEILYLTSAVSSTTFKINKDLKFNVKFDPPTPKRRMSDSHIDDFVIQKYGRGFDAKNPGVAIRKITEESSEDRDFSKEGPVMSTSSQQSRSFSDSNSDSDDSSKKTLATSGRSLKKHKRKHTSIKPTSTKNSKYKIPTTTHKKKKTRSHKRHHHRQKNKEDNEEDDKRYNRDTHEMLYDQTHYSTKPKPLVKHVSNFMPRSKLKNVKGFDDGSKLLLPSLTRNKHVQRKRPSKTAYRHKDKTQSPAKHKKPRSGGIIDSLIDYFANRSPDVSTQTEIVRMSNKSEIPSSQRFDYLKNKSKSVVETVKSQKWIEKLELIKNKSETLVFELVNTSLALYPQMQEELQQQLLNTTHEEIDNHINTGLAIEEQVNNLAEQTGTLSTELINTTAKLWQPWTHNVEDDAKVISFIRRIPNHYSKLFRVLERKTTDDNWKHALKKIERLFKNKFEEFINETAHNKIKSRTGTKRVVLNSIGVSNRIIRRLFNYVLGDMNNKALLRNNDKIDIIDKQINIQKYNELHRACVKLEFCGSSKGFAAYIFDILTTLCSSGNKKFKGAFASLSKVLKKTQFAGILGKGVEREIQKKVAQYDHVRSVYKRTMVAIVKNIIANRNSPLIVYGDSQVDQINKTMALLEIVNILDENVAGNLENLQEWNDIKNNLLNYTTNEGADDIDTITTAIITNIIKVISELDKKLQEYVVQNVKIIFT